MIDNDILERVLAEGLRTGADFAEVFASDWRGTGVGLDDGKIEQLSTGRNRGAGIRVIAGETTGFAHTADLSEAGLMVFDVCQALKTTQLTSKSRIKSE